MRLMNGWEVAISGFMGCMDCADGTGGSLIGLYNCCRGHVWLLLARICVLVHRKVNEILIIRTLLPQP